MTSFMLMWTLALPVQDGDQPQVPPAPRTKDELDFQLSVMTMQEGDYYTAHLQFEQFIYLYPSSKFTSQAKDFLFESAFQLMHAGHPMELDILGIEIPFIKTRTKGLTLLRQALSRYPNEEFTPDYYMKLAEYFMTEGEYDQAELEYRTVVELYPNSRHAAKAILGLGRAAHSRFSGSDYDTAPLLEAKRQFQRIVDEYTEHKEAVKEATSKLDMIDELLAKKDFDVASFYEDRDLVRAARMYYGEVVHMFPKTSWGRLAKQRLDALGGPLDLKNEPPDEDDE